MYSDYLIRIELIQNWFMDHPNQHVNKLLDFLPDMNRGTISCNLSQMKKAGHLLHKEKGLYPLPENPANPEKVARDIAEMLRDNRKKVNGTRKARTIQTSLKMEMNDYTSEISRAVELLKSKGYKILAPVTEFKEI